MKKFLLMCFSFGFAISVWAQDRVVTGKLTSKEDGSALPGVNVVLKGTTIGTISDADGNYKISVPSSGGTLVFSFIGLQTLEVAIGELSILDAQLSADVKSLTEVVVTALGVSKEEKTLGYAATTISSQLLANKPENDIGRALQGRTPGLQVLNSSGLAGSGSKINIRGSSSITGNTQPLWVVNGVPINTDQNDISSQFQDGNVAPTRFLDLDPNNIESLSVLRGLSATTLYGSQGRNGVILVTTKTGYSKGASKFEGSVTQSYFATQAVVPEFQNKWANGFDGAYGEFFSNWGSLFNGKPVGANDPYFEWKDIFPNRPEFAVDASTVQPGQTKGGYIPIAQPNNVKDFFQTGGASTTSLSLSSRNELGSVSFSYSHLDEKGFVLNNNVVRDNFSLGGSAKLSNKLSFTGTYNYVRTSFETPPTGAGNGSGSLGGPSIFTSLFYTPRNIDLTNLPWENPLDHSNVYYRNNKSITNPYWTLHNARQTDLTSRFFSSSSLKYNILNWLDVTYRIGYDTYTEKQSYWLNKGAATDFASELLPGVYRTTTGLSTVIDHSILVGLNKNLSQDISFNALAGGNYRSNAYVQEGLESLGQVYYGLLEHRNFTSTQPKDYVGNNLNYQRNSAIAGVFASADLGYKNYLYLTLSGRNDWTSTLEKANRRLFYPGGSISFIPTALFPNFANSTFEFLKIRVAYGTSANFGTPYNTRPYSTLNPQARVDAISNVVTSRISSLLANPNLKAELLSETEFGIESKLFNNRIKLDVSYYSRKAKNQIIQRPLDTSTGYSSVYINAGTISNKGLEARITFTPIRTGDWQLDVTTNFTKNVSKVESLPEGSKQILVSSPSSNANGSFSGFTNLGNFAIEGKPLNVIQGSYTLKAPNGQFQVTPSGNYAVSTDIGIIGNPNPDWLGSVITNLSWKSISFGMQWDYVSGGQILSYTTGSLIGRGVAKDLQNFDPTLPLVLPGQLQQLDKNGDVVGYIPNNIPLTTAGVFFGNSIIGTGAADRGIYDATRVRFREASLTYNLPKSLISKYKLKGVNISLVANNIWWRAINAPKYTHADFDRTAFGSNNGAGFDFLGGPSARRYGATVKITF